MQPWMLVPLLRWARRARRGGSRLFGGGEPEILSQLSVVPGQPPSSSTGQTARRPRIKILVSSSLGLVGSPSASHLIFLRKSFLNYEMGVKITVSVSWACYGRGRLCVLGLAQSGSTRNERSSCEMFISDNTFHLRAYFI